MTGPRPLGSAAMVRLVAAREISSRLRDKNFIISSVVTVLVLVGLLGFQVAIDSGSDTIRVKVFLARDAVSGTITGTVTAAGGLSTAIPATPAQVDSG